MKHSDFDLRWHTYEPRRDTRCKQADSDCCASKFCFMLISFLCALTGVKISCAYKPCWKRISSIKVSCRRKPHESWCEPSSAIAVLIRICSGDRWQRKSISTASVRVVPCSKTNVLHMPS